MSPANFCNECGARLRPEARFCGRCGNPVRSQQSLPPEVTPKPEQSIPWEYPSEHAHPRNNLLQMIFKGAAVLAALMCLASVGIGVLILKGHKTSEPENTQIVQQTEFPTETNASVIIESTGTNTAIPTPSGPDKWLVLMYSDADDKGLEEGMLFDANEAELAGSTERVQIVLQLDRFPGAYEGEGNWTGTHRYSLSQDKNLRFLASPISENLGELNSGDLQSLVDFAVWAIQTYQANRYVLILSDHGGGWTGIAWDDDPFEDSHLKINGLDKALGEILSRTGISQFEIIVLDACLMAQLEVLSGLAPYAHYGVASEETVPFMGMAYSSFLSDLIANPDMGSNELAKRMVESYITRDTLVTNSQARGEYFAGYEQAEMSNQEMLDEYYREVTMSAVDLTRLAQLHEALNQLVLAMTQENQSPIASARSYAQSYYNLWEDVPNSFLDLSNFTALVQSELGVSPSQQDGSPIASAADSLQVLIQDAVLIEIHGAQLPGSTGISIFFPNSELFQKTISSQYSGYTSNASRFAAASLWDDFLLYHYTSKPVDASTADPTVVLPGAPPDPENLVTTPEEIGPITPPGSGEFSISPVTVSKEKFTVEDTVQVNAEVRGSNIGYIYYIVMQHDPNSGDYLMADAAFMYSDQSQEIGGVVYPDWGDTGNILLERNWKPAIYYLSDGLAEEFALIQPESYGRSREETFYSVKGIYIFSDNGSQVDSYIYFTADGEMSKVWGEFGSETSSAWRQINPKEGDKFTVMHQWWTTKNNPQGESYYQKGGTLTFGKTPFTWVTHEPESGVYVLGYVAEDIDGNLSYSLNDVEIID